MDAYLGGDEHLRAQLEGDFRWRWIRDHNVDNRWFDFGYQLVVLSDGTVGYTVDHVAADGAAAVLASRRSRSSARVSARPRWTA